VIDSAREKAAFEARIRQAYPDEAAARILGALELAVERSGGAQRASGEPSWMHGIRVASLLVELGMDEVSATAGLLHDLGSAGREGEASPEPVVEDRPTRRKPAKAKAPRLEDDLPPEIAARFGEEVALIVSGVTRLADLRARNRTVHAAEGIRKMLFAMTKDIRVIIVKLADKLDSMRTLRWLPEERQKVIATECLDIYAPLADRLGVSWLKDELEDLALKVLNREAFDQIKDIVAEKKEERESFLARVEAAIHEASRAEGFAAAGTVATTAGGRVEVQARAKHFYSIYQKMRRRAKGAEELFDLFGVRLICPSENDCYTLLGLVHRLWKPIEGRFKDYIAMPKANGYRSLHTTVMCFEGRLLEVQIRTADMHRVAEFGVASHWLYKKGSGAEQPRPEDLGIVNRLKAWSDFLSSGAEFLEEIKRELLRDSIFVFTPQGDVIELPAGAGPLDFAFAIHSDVGMRCVGAKADGQIVSLDGELRNTQVVEILTSPAAHPTMNWLALAKTTKARSKIRAWLVQSGQVLAIEKNIVAKNIVAKNIIAKNIVAKNTVVGRKAGPTPPHGAGHAAGHGTVPLSHNATPQARGEEERRLEFEAKPTAPGPDGATLEFRAYDPGEEVRNERAGVAIGGARGLVIRIAGCCRPVTGDPIAGYVSRGRGIIVHRADCRTLRAIPDFGERGIAVSWEAMSPFVTARFRLTARRSPDLFSEIESAVRKFRGHLREGRLGERSDGSYEGSFTMEVEQLEDVRRVIKAVRGIPSVLTIQEG
jgi:GTP pyrophosphokinase